ncbi:MAG: protein kinase [Planctomyces sp.]|nr:protein kinase [Planctomyces sp.]
MNQPELTVCPDRAQLQQLLSGQTSDSEFSKLEAHLLQCDRCSREADALIPSAEVTAMLTRAETQIFRTREVELVERLIRKVRTLRTPPPAVIDKTLIGSGDAGNDPAEVVSLNNSSPETKSKPVPTVEFDSNAVSFLRPAEQTDEIGRLGGYRILQVLGSGGMGVVYRAEDPSLKRLVALKVMKPVIAANREAKARFMKEAEATAAIEHDNIVTIYQVGEDNGVPFIAMQFLKGESLQARLDRCGRLEDTEVARIAKEIANGLHAAHVRGLIHRDIKPDNIWLQEGNDRVRILDFGLVRNNAEDASLTQSGIVLGTPKYMAPEQACGGDVDHRCDLFSLGSVMYRMLTGKSPFEGSNLTATLIAVAHHSPQPLTVHAPNVSPQLADIITRLLKKNASERPTSARDVALELKELRTEPQQVDDLPNPPIRPRLFLRMGGIAALILLAIIVIRLQRKDGTIVVELETAVPVSEVEIDGSQVRFTPDESGKLLTVSVPEGSHELILRTPDGVALKTEPGTQPVRVTVSETTRIRAWLERPSTAVVGNVSTPAIRNVLPPVVRNAQKPWPAGPFPSWSGQGWTWAALKDGNVLPGLIERPAELENIGRWNVDTIYPRGTVNVARYSPDGNWLATGSGDGHVRVYSAASMQLHQLLPGFGGFGAGDLSWHPDNRRIAVVADHANVLRIWTIEGQLLHEEVVHDSTLAAVAWTFDGSRLICGGDNRLDVRNVDGSLLKSLTEGQPTNYCGLGNIAASPNLQRFACWHGDAVRIWNAETFEVEHVIDIPDRQTTGGHRIRWGSKDRISLSCLDRLVICGADGSVLKEFPAEPLCAVAWRPDGDHLTVWRAEPYELDPESGTVTPPERRIQVWPETGPVPTAVDWSPDGRHLVLAGGRLAVCDRDLRKIEFDTGTTVLPVSCVSLTPDGSQIASVSQIGDNCLRIWSSDGASYQVMSLNEPASLGARLAWSPDGKHMAAGWPQSSHYRIGRIDGSFLTVPGSCVSLAWNPDGTQLAAGLANGHIKITDTNGRTRHEFDTGENGGVIVGWSKHGLLVAHAGKKFLRITLDGDGASVSLLAEAPGTPAHYTVAVWRPDGMEVCFGDNVHVNVADGVTDRVREASPAAAWSPDGSLYLQLATLTALLRPDGTQSVFRRGMGLHQGGGAWSPSDDTIFLGYDQSMMMARKASDLHVNWSAVILPGQKSVSFDVGGSVLHGDRETLERQFAFYSADETGSIGKLALSQFELKTGEEVLPVPGRYFDSEYRFAVNPGTDWQEASLDAVMVPGIARAAYSRPGGVSLNLFIQETGAVVDPSWLVAESARAQEEKHSAVVVEKEVRQIAGRDAMWMVVEGQGTGSAITGSGSVKTRQHWIAIPHEDNILVALLTSPSGTFDSHQKLFLKAMETLALD